MLIKNKLLKNQIKEITDIRTLRELIDDSNLKPIQKDIIKLKYHNHLTLKEIALKKGYSEVYIYKMHISALNTIKPRLDIFINNILSNKY